jgi:hypothetical protein
MLLLLSGLFLPKVDINPWTIGLIAQVDDYAVRIHP